jgi:hypothetical protein
MAVPAKVVAARFAQGAQCLVATAGNGQIAGYLWLVIGPYEEDEVRARFVPHPQPTTAWDFDVTVLPHFRMGRLFSYLWARAGVDLAARGVTHTVSRISAFNAASMSAHRRMGASTVGCAAFLRLGRWQIMRSSVPPRWHVSRHDNQRPVLVIATAPSRSYASEP